MLTSFFRVQLNSNFPLIVGIVLSFATTSITEIIRRQDARLCVPGTLLGRVGVSNGGRKIGIVIDESLSMQDNDPDNIRIRAGKALDNSLVSKAEAGNGKTADFVTVVGFHASPDLLYPLGDPAGAIPIIDAISEFISPSP